MYLFGEISHPDSLTYQVYEVQVFEKGQTVPLSWEFASIPDAIAALLLSLTTEWKDKALELSKRDDGHFDIEGINDIYDSITIKSKVMDAILINDDHTSSTTDTIENIDITSFVYYDIGNNTYCIAHGLEYLDDPKAIIDEVEYDVQIRNIWGWISSDGIPDATLEAAVLLRSHIIKFPCVHISGFTEFIGRALGEGIKVLTE